MPRDLIFLHRVVNLLRVAPLKALTLSNHPDAVSYWMVRMSFHTGKSRSDVSFV
jgi:hypothetical protein